MRVPSRARREAERSGEEALGERRGTSGGRQGKEVVE
jgi:hypothetical protein